MRNELLIGNNFINIPETRQTLTISNMDNVASMNNSKIQTLGTILNNMSHYGFIPSAAAYQKMSLLSDKELTSFWLNVEPVFKEETGANRNMDKFVVYKNFPKEVLEKSEAQYWISQILMYWGVPNEFFTEEVESRPQLTEKKSLKVLALAKEDTLDIIFANLTKNTARWSDKQELMAKQLYKDLKVNELNLDSFSFKENGIILINEAMKDVSLLLSINQNKIKISNATDVMRLAAAMSEGDISLRENTKFKKFSRPQRRFLLAKLEDSNNLVEDLGLRKEQFKKLLAGLHPGDYKYEKVKQAYDLLYRDQIKTFNSQVDQKLLNKDNSVLELLKTRPGDFFRRFHKTYDIFNREAINAFSSIVSELKTIQLLKLDSYLMTVNARSKLLYAPKGNWTKAQLVDNTKVEFKAEDLKTIHQTISEEIADRLNDKFPNGINLDIETDNIKLQTNDQKLATYGRGTSFDIPENMKFIRSASYWENKSYGNNWFDNGWNFFDENWEPKGTCCWNHTHDMKDAAVFSGDPTNSKDLDGKACQMIDLYLDKLEDAGVKYAVWNILSYSNIKFSDATDVLGTLQWGEKPEEGNLYEPSRAQMVFPITGDNLTKYIAYIDVVARKLVYIDANLYGHVQSAGSNISHLKEKMPAYLEYLKSLPSVADLFVHAKKGITPVIYSDKNHPIAENEIAYVFKPENANNDFIKLDLPEILDSGKVIKQKKSLKP